MIDPTQTLPTPPPGFAEAVAIIQLSPAQSRIRKADLFRLRISLAIAKQIGELEMGYLDTMDALQGVLEDTLALMRSSGSNFIHSSPCKPS